MENCGKLLVLDDAELPGYSERVSGQTEPGPAFAEMRACSACAGDYEDPDRTAGEEFEAMLAGEDADEEENGSEA